MRNGNSDYMNGKYNCEKTLHLEKFLVMKYRVETSVMKCNRYFYSTDGYQKKEMKKGI